MWGALANCGQNCGAVERVFVVESVAARFMEHLLEEVGRIRTGDPFQAGTDVGPILTAKRRLALHHAVSEAVADGAELICGGSMPEGPGFFYPPTVVLGPRLESRLLSEEIAGPVIPVVPVPSLERAIMLANSTEYALTASGWTRSSETAERLMSGLQAGVVTVNDVLYSFGEPASTWSGHRKSGMGQNHGTPGLREMSRQRFASFDPTTCEAPLFAFPYDDGARRLVDACLGYLNGKSWARRVGSLARLIGSSRFRRRTPLRSLFNTTRRRV